MFCYHFVSQTFQILPFFLFYNPYHSILCCDLFSFKKYYLFFLNADAIDLVQYNPVFIQNFKLGKAYIKENAESSKWCSVYILQHQNLSKCPSLPRKYSSALPLSTMVSASLKSKLLTILS